MRQKKVFISAYVCGNLGDDLFIKILCQRYTNTQFYLCGQNKYTSFFEDIENLHYIATDKKAARRILTRWCENAKINMPYIFRHPPVDAFVKIGGSVFMQPQKWDERQTHDAINYIKPYKHKYVLGANFGPYTHPHYEELHRKYFNLCDDVCFRDKYSAQLFADLGHVRQADDIIFQLQHPPQQEENTIVFSVIHCAHRPLLQDYHTHYMEKNLALIRAVLRHGSRVLLMGFCAHEKDPLAMEALYAALSPQEQAMVSLYTHDNIDTSLNILAKAKGIVASRFHATILGLLFGKATIPLCYSKKTTHILQDIHYDNPYYDIQNLQQMDIQACADFLQNGKAFSVQDSVKNAKKHFEKLDALLLPT